MSKFGSIGENSRYDKLFMGKDALDFGGISGIKLSGFEIPTADEDSGLVPQVDASNLRKHSQSGSSRSIVSLTNGALFDPSKVGTQNVLQMNKPAVIADIDQDDKNGAKRGGLLSAIKGPAVSSRELRRRNQDRRATGSVTSLSQKSLSEAAGEKSTVDLHEKFSSVTESRLMTPEEAGFSVPVPSVSAVWGKPEVEDNVPQNSKLDEQYLLATQNPIGVLAKGSSPVRVPDLRLKELVKQHTGKTDLDLNDFLQESKSTELENELVMPSIKTDLNLGKLSKDQKKKQAAQARIEKQEATKKAKEAAKLAKLSKKDKSNRKPKSKSEDDRGTEQSVVPATLKLKKPKTYGFLSFILIVVIAALAGISVLSFQTADGAGSGTVMAQKQNEALQKRIGELEVELQSANTAALEAIKQLNDGGFGAKFSKVKNQPIEYSNELLSEMSWNGLSLFVPKNGSLYALAVAGDKITLTADEIRLQISVVETQEQMKDYLLERLNQFNSNLGTSTANVLIEKTEDTRSFMQVSYVAEGVTYSKYFTVVQVIPGAYLYIESDFSDKADVATVELFTEALKANVMPRFVEE